MGRAPRPREFDYEKIAKTKTEKKLTYAEAAKAFGCSIPTVKRAMRNGSTLGPGIAHKGLVLPAIHRAVVDGVSFHANSKVRDGKTALRDPAGEVVIKSGSYSGKLGGLVTKGWWKGFPIYTLKLEERATCPRSCRQWLSCYGNNMPFAHRYRHGPDLEAAICREVRDLARKHRRGFVIRLHDLGDFYSLGYVNLWIDMLRLYPALHIFGYTARQEFETDQISRAIDRAQRAWWPRFAIRWSDGDRQVRSTIAIEKVSDCPSDAIICPAQTGKTQRCGSCGLCWTTERRIAFIQH